MRPGKPHIERAQPYDGDGWVCYGKPNGTGFGDSPVAAYRDWLDPNSGFKYRTVGEGARQRLASGRPW